MKNRKNVKITVIQIDGKRVTRCVRTPPRQRLTAAGVDALLDNEAERVARFFPDREFRLVPLLDGNFNFVETVASDAGEAT